MTNLKATEFNRLTGVQLNKMSEADLRSIVSQQAKVANKRMKNIKANVNASQQAVASAERSGGAFKVSGKKGKLALVKEAKRIQNFNKAKTGTVKGAIEVKAKSERIATGQSAIEASKEAESNYKRSAKAKLKKSGKKLTKKRQESINKKAKQVGEKAAEEVRKKTAEKVKSHEKAKEKQARSDRGKDYYDKNAKGVGDDSEIQSVKSPKDSDQTHDFMETDQTDYDSPLDLSENDESDDDFITTDGIDIPSDFKVYR